MNKHKFFIRVLLLYISVLFLYIGYFLLVNKNIDPVSLFNHTTIIHIVFIFILASKLAIDKLINIFINKIMQTKISTEVDGPEWEYGTCCLTKARRNKETKIIQIYFDSTRLQKPGWFSVELFDGCPFIPYEAQQKLF